MELLLEKSNSRPQDWLAPCLEPASGTAAELAPRAGERIGQCVTILSGTKLFLRMRPEGSIPGLPSKAIFILVWRAWQSALEARLPLP